MLFMNRFGRLTFFIDKLIQNEAAGSHGWGGWEGLPWARVGERCFLDEHAQLQALDLVGVEGGEGPSRTPGPLLLSGTHRLQALLKLLFTWYSISRDWVSRHTWLAIYGLDYAYKFNFPRQIDVPVDGDSIPRMSRFGHDLS